MAYRKVSSLEDVRRCLSVDGWKLYHDPQGKVWLQKGGETMYIPAFVRDQDPDLFIQRSESEKKLMLLVEEAKPPEKKPESSSDTEQYKPVKDRPGVDIQPEEFILHDTERRLLESVWVLERLHEVAEEQRKDLPFARTSVNAKNQTVIDDATMTKIRLSLADLAIRFLVDTYLKYQNVEPTIASLNIEKMAWYNAYLQAKNRVDELEAVLAFKLLVN